MERMTCPTEILSPSFTRIFVTVPEAVEGTGATAFSFSSSMIVWPSLIRSPSFTRRLTTTPESAPSPSFGRLTSIGLSLKTGHAKRAHRRCHQEKPQSPDSPSVCSRMVAADVRACAKTRAGQEAYIDQNNPHPDPLPSDGRGNSQTCRRHFPKRLKTPTDGGRFSLSHPMGEGRGEGDCVSKSEVVFARVLRRRI